MNTTSTINTSAVNINTIGNLTQPLQSSVFIPMVASKDKAVAAGNRWCKLIKKGENSKLAASLAVEVPQMQVSILADAITKPAISEYLLASLEQLQNGYIKSRAEAGALSIQYSELSLVKLEEFAGLENEASGIGQISSERITNWFNAELRDLWIVALSDRLGISESATDADVKRLEQIANQTRDNLAKLASKKPVHFDERVRNALNAALACANEDDSFAQRISAKLNIAVSDDDMLASLGM